MQFGWTTDERNSIEVLDAFVAANGNFIDTADIYTMWGPRGMEAAGESEKIIGRWMAARGNRQNVVLATKVRGKMWEGPDGGALPGPRPPLLRGLAPPAEDGPHRPLPMPLGRSRDADRRDPGRPGRPGSRRQGALRRGVELPRLAPDGGTGRERAARIRAVRELPTAVFADGACGV